MIMSFKCPFHYRGNQCPGWILLVLFSGYPIFYLPWFKALTSTFSKVCRNTPQMSLSNKRKPSLESMHCAVVTERLITVLLRLQLRSEWSLRARGYPSTLSQTCLVPPGGGLLQQEKMTFVLLSRLEHWVRAEEGNCCELPAPWAAPAGRRNLFHTNCSWFLFPQATGNKLLGLMYMKGQGERMGRRKEEGGRRSWKTELERGLSLLLENRTHIV